MIYSITSHPVVISQKRITSGASQGRFIAVLPGWGECIRESDRVGDRRAPPARPRSECIRGHPGESRQERTTVEQTWFQTSVNRSGLGLHWRRAAQARQAHEKHISLRLPAQGRSTRLGSGAGVQLERQTGVAICLHGDS